MKIILWWSTPGTYGVYSNTPLVISNQKSIMSILNIHLKEIFDSAGNPISHKESSEAAEDCKGPVSYTDQVVIGMDVECLWVFRDDIHDLDLKIPNDANRSFTLACLADLCMQWSPLKVLLTRMTGKPGRSPQLVQAHSGGWGWSHGAQP